MKRNINADHWLLNKPIAHRGLWGDKIIENSIPAYANAVKNGYPIEIDLYLTKDGHLVSFHDKTLLRMTGEKGYVYDKTLKQLNQLCLQRSKEKIPTFDQVLEVVNGLVPLLIEIKNQPNKKVVDLVVKRLKNYTGEFAIQSFNPLYVKRVKKLAPDFLRGILSTNKVENEGYINSFIVQKMPLNFIVKPDFISYEYKGLPLSEKKKKNLPIIAWTVTNKTDYENIKPYCNNIIFEKFIP